jgi:hypothetical protein
MKVKQAQRTPCPDCGQCQGCSRSRCRACLKGGRSEPSRELAPGFTYGEYLVWRKRKEQK